MPYHKSFKDTLYNKNWLERVYVHENRNAAQVAALIGCDKSAVLRNLRKHEIPIKDASEAQKLAPHPGSNAPRPRKEFKDTLHNIEWIKARAHLNASEIARDAGSSVPSAQEAMKAAGVVAPNISDAKAGRPAPYKRKPKGAPISRTTAHRRATAICPEGACVLCGDIGDEVNHIDRDWENNSLENLERLCTHCHNKQHSEELFVMINKIKYLGISYADIWSEARANLVAKGVTSAGNKLGAVEALGLRKSVQEWAKFSGIGESAIRRRLARGWEPERAVTAPIYEDKLLTFEGFKDTIAGHSRRKGLDVGIVYSRLNNGWSLDRALNTPMRS